MTDLSREFLQRNQEKIELLAADEELKQLTHQWFVASSQHEYSYHFTWMGRPIIQFPQDMIAMQEIIWQTRPDVIIETGIAHGGSLIYYASLCEMIGHGAVLGVDVDIRAHNRTEIEKHSMYKRITMLEGSSVDEEIARQVHEYAQGKSVLLILDSNHTHNHVLRELELYSPLVKKGGYLVVFDTIIEDMPDDFFPERPWGVGDNPKTAVREFLTKNDRFQIDASIPDKLLITVAPDGYLKCVKD
ncbi:MAG TPA: cephalosporin hydroxylase family protein [Abditibacteriaceae bacterium]